MVVERWTDERLDDLRDTVRAMKDLPMHVARLDVAVENQGKVLDALPATLERLEDKLDAAVAVRKVSPAARLTALVTVATSVIAAVAVVLSAGAPS